MPSTAPFPSLQGLPIFNSPATDSEPAVLVQDFVLRNGNAVILNKMSFAVPKGSLFAIIGESGAGKTTTLRMLGRRLNEDVLTMEGTGIVPTNTWYIPQEHGALYEYDTPLQVITFLHQMMFESGHAEATSAARDILRIVEVSDDDMSKLVGNVNTGLSLSNRRLVGVAAALCARAEVLLLDEITTGLDSSTARSVVDVLRNVTKAKGVTIVCTIHQPSDEVMSMFDDVLVLRRTGAYEAAALTEADLATGESFADLFLTTPSEPRTISAAHKNLIAAQTQPTLQAQMASQPKSGGFINDLALLTKRTAQRQWNNIFAFRLRTALYAAMGLLMGFSFFGMPMDDATFLRDWLGFFLMMTASSFMAIVIASGFFPLEEASFRNENLQSHVYSLTAMSLGRFVVEAGVAIVSSLFSFVTMAIVGIEHEMARFWFAIVLQYFVSDSFGFLVSTVFRVEVSIGAVIPVVGWMSSLLGSGLASPPKSGAGWTFHVVKWLSFFKYSFASVATDQFPYLTGTCDPLVNSGCSFPNSQAVLEFVDLDDPSNFLHTYKFQWLILAGIAILFRIFSFLRLRSIVKSSKLSYENVTKHTVPTDEIEAAPRPDPHAPRIGDTVAIPVQGSTEPTAESSTEMAPVAAETPSHERDMRRSFTTVPWAGASLSWEGLRIQVQEKKTLTTLLDRMSGRAMAGSVTAIIGRAKVGKTLFLSVLSQMVPIQNVSWKDCTGKVCMKLEDGTEKYDYAIGLAYQIDAFVPNDNVSAAILRNMRTPDEYEKKWLLKSMGISHIEYKNVSEISGGQLRRLSIACQIARKPQVLLLDEPTSGLDAAVAFDIMRMIQEYARNTNTIVLCTLQQPGKMLMGVVDQFMFMHQGTVAFHGTLDDTVAKYNITDEDTQTMSPTDVVVKRLSGYAKDADGWQHNESSDAAPADTITHQKLPTMGESWSMKGFSMLLKRTHMTRFHNPVGLLVETAGKFLALPIIISIIFADLDDASGVNRVGLFAIISGCFGFCAAIFPPVLLAPERIVYDREVSAGDYTPAAHMLAKWCYELPLELLGLLGGCAITYGVIGLDMNFGIWYLTNVLVFHACLGIGYMVGSFPLPINAACGLSAFMIVNYMLGMGVMVTPAQIARVWFPYIMEMVSPLRHGLLVQVNSEFSSVQRQSFGWNRDTIDEAQFSWIMLAVFFVQLRMLGINAPMMLHFLKRRKTPLFRRGATTTPPQVVVLEQN